MRKLSKKISMLMVLAMLVGLFSGVVSASAASAWSFASGKYDVAVNGSINMESKEYADFDLLKDGAAPAGYTVAWASSDEDVVWVNAKTGQLRANKFGKAADGDKAVISATFTNTATKKSATRSFTIVLGAAKADFTVEAADVTIALGEEVKFAPVVKDAAGNVVKFATHKSYNGYFLDGKAIANPWTPEEAGEYTVTVAQFAKKADVADLAKAVRKDEVKVTVTVDADFDAKATGVKEITVYGAFAADAKFTVKKGAQNVTFTTTVAADGKSAKLALGNKLTNGTYTVAYGDAKVDIVAEDEKADAIIVLENGGQILTSSDKNGEKVYAYAHYDVLNQYGESVRRVFDPSWTTTADSYSANANTGIITLYEADGFDYNDMVVLTGVVTGYGFAKSETATMTIGLERNINSVDVLGIVKGEGTDLIEEIPASYIGAPYYLVFATYDNAGNLIEFEEDKAQSDLKFISLNPLLAKFANDVDVETVYIDGVAYGKVKIEAPSVDTQVKKGGVAEISITSTKTGKSTPYNIRIVSEQILDSFKVFAPDTLLVRNTVKDEDSTFYFGFEALDTKGEKITDFRALYKAVQFSDSAVKLSENNDGTATLSFNAKDVESNDGFDSIAVFNATVLTSGKTEMVRLNIKPDRYAASVAGFAIQNNSEYVVEGNTIGLDFFGNSWSGKEVCVQFADQYDSILEAKNANLLRKGQYIGIKPLETGVLSVVTDYNGEAYDNVVGYEETLTDGTVIFDLLAARPAYDEGKKEWKVNEKDETVYESFSTASLLADDDVQVSKKAAVVEFAIYEYVQVDGEWVYKLVGGSDKKFTFYVVDIDQCVEFSVNRTERDGRLLYDFNNEKHIAKFSTSATLANGKKVNLANSTSNYFINYSANGNDVFENVASTTSGAAIAVDPALKKGEKAEDDVKVTIFNDYSKPAAKAGEYEPRNHKFNVTATVYDWDNNVKGSGATEIEVSNRYPYDVSFSFTPDWALDWKLSLNGDRTVGTVKAEEGVITKKLLSSIINGVINYYGDTVGADVTLTITKLVESENGLNPNGENLALGTGDNALENAEIGDTFLATYTKGGLKHETKFTVGSDTNAWFAGSNFDTATWR